MYIDVPNLVGIICVCVYECFFSLVCFMLENVDQTTDMGFCVLPSAQLAFENKLID